MIIHALRLWVSEVYKSNYEIWYERSTSGNWISGPVSQPLKATCVSEWWHHFNKVLELDTHDCWPPDYD